MAKEGEVGEDYLSLTSGNKYYEQGHGKTGRMVNQLQGNIKLSHQIMDTMKMNSEKIFQQMRTDKEKYINTLLNGEKQGLCKGIKKRQDPSLRYQLRMSLEK